MGTTKIESSFNDVASPSMQGCVEIEEPRIEQPSNDKPYLTPPNQALLKKGSLSMTDGVMLCHQLDKLLIETDYLYLSQTKGEIEVNQQETAKLQQEKIEAMRLANEKEKETARWALTTKFFSWMTSVLSIVTGVLLLGTGGGAVAGTLLIVGGSLNLLNQILEITGAWKKIAELLPGDDPETKRAIIAWMQFGIALFCVILGAAGAIVQGVELIKESLTMARMFMGVVAGLGNAVTSAGQGISEGAFKESLASVKKKLMQLRESMTRGEDLQERAEDLVQTIGNQFEQLGDLFKIHDESYQTLQEAW